MWVEFISFYDKAMLINTDKITYIYESDSSYTWIVFGSNDFELRVKHSYDYVVKQLAKAQAGG